MAFHQLGGPQLPILEHCAEGVLAALVTVASQKLTRGGRSSRARIEQRDVDFALREGAVDKRQIADDGGQETKAKARFGDHQNVREGGAGENIAEAQSKKCCAAEVQVRPEAGLRSGDIDRGARAELH